MPPQNEEILQFKKQFDLLSSHTPEYEYTVPYIVEHVVNHLPQQGHFIDVGAGRGNLSKSLSKHFGTSTIVEPNTLYYQELLDWAISHHVPMHGFNKAWLDVEMEGQRADLILMSHVLYYVPSEQWLTFLRKAYDLLNPDGRIVIILNLLNNGVGRLYKEFLQAHEWWEIATAEAVEALLRRECFTIQTTKFASTIYADTSAEIQQLIDFLLLGRAKFDTEAKHSQRAAYAEAHLKHGAGYAIQANAGLIIVKKEADHAR